MIYHLFDAFSLIFWATLFILFLVEIAVAETDSGLLGLWWVLAWLIGVVVFSDFNPLPWVKAHWVLTILASLGYVGAGVAYALVRWVLLVRDPAAYKEVEYKFVKGQPRVLDPNWFKDRIISWLMWWPSSLVWQLLQWPRKLFANIYNLLYKTLRSIADKAASGISSE